MDFVIRAQWRLVRRSFCTWTLLGFGLTAVFYQRPNGSSTSFDIGEHAITIPLLAILGAALGVRLFVSELATPMGMYWRGLPITPRTLLFKKLGFGAAVLAASLALSMLWTYAGLAHLLRSLIVPDALREPPAVGSWLAAYLWSLFVFVLTAYFALAFDRVAASREAGVPGFFVGSYLAASPALLEFGGVLPAPLGHALVATVAVAAVVVLWDARAVVSGKVTEPLRRSPRGMEIPLLAFAQLLLVVVPLVAALDYGDMWPYFGLHPWAGNALLWLAIGLLLLPWSRREIRRHGLRHARAAATLALNLTGAGIAIWLAIRARRGERAPRLQNLTPFVVMFLAFVLYLGGSLLLGGQRYARAWKVTVDDPEIEILIDGEPRGQGTALGVRWGPRLGPKLGLGSSHSGTGISGPALANGILRVADLQKMLRERGSSAGSLDGADLLHETFGDEAVIELRYRGLAGTARDVSLTFRQSGFYSHSQLHLDPRFPAMEELAAQLVASPTDALLARAASLGDRFLAELMRRENPQRWRNGSDETRPDLDAARARRQQVLQVLDRVLEHSAQPTPAQAQQTAWRALQADDSTLDQVAALEWLVQHVQDQYPRLRRLAAAGAAADPLWTSAAREGELHGVLVAGLGQRRARYEDLRRAYGRHTAEQPDIRLSGQIHTRRIAAAWAMLATDPARAVPALIESLDDAPDLALAKLLAFSTSSDADAALAGWLALSDSDLATRFARDGEQTRVTLERCRDAIANGMGPQEFWEWSRRIL